MWLWWLTSPNLKCEPPRLIRVNGTVLLWWITALKPRKDCGAREVERQTAKDAFSFLHGRGSVFFFYCNVQLIRYSLPEIWRATFFPVLTNSRLPRRCSGKESSGNAEDTRDTSSSPGVSGGGNGNHYSVLAWKIPWTEEPGRLYSMGSVRHDWALSTLLIKMLIPSKTDS